MKSREDNDWTWGFRFNQAVEEILLNIIAVAVEE